MHRLWLRFAADGDAGLAHRSRGRASPRRITAADRAAALAAYRARYRGFGPTLFAEKLAEHEGTLGQPRYGAPLAEGGGTARADALSAAHTRADLEFAVSAFKKVKASMAL